MFLSPDGNQVRVIVYRITGKQLFFTVPRSACEECDLAVTAVTKAIQELDGMDISFKVEAWLRNLPLALFRGAYHPPITLVDGKVISQGVVPDVQEVKHAIVDAAEKRVRPAARQPHLELPNLRALDGIVPSFRSTG